MKKITIAKGDGIGPEIMDATLSILKAAGAELVTEEIEIGEKVYLSGNTSGITPEAWDSIRKNKIFLKSPITTPQGGGYKSINVTTRKMLGLFSNVRPTKSYYPFVETKHPNIDLVIIRENEEDLYAAIEHRQTDEVYQCLKLITRPGCEKIIRYAFEYSVANGRKKVTCFTKDNIMKLTDGLFHKVFDEIGKEYPDIQKEHMIIDIGAAKLADTPNAFDVIVTLNLYGDVISDIASQIAGSVGLAGSANIGKSVAMFEAIHGSAPDIAGRNIANPSGLLQGAIMMLNHIGQNDIAGKIENAWLKTLEDGIHTADIYKEGKSKRKVGTNEFAKAVIQRLGEKPKNLPTAKEEKSKPVAIPDYVRSTPKKKEIVGIDVFLDWNEGSPSLLGEKLSKLNSVMWELTMITNRGVKVWPENFDETFCTDHWRCRFKARENTKLNYEDILRLLYLVNREKLDIIKTENLCTFDGVAGYSLGQGQ